VPKNVWVQHRHNYAGPLGDVRVARGALLWWPRTYYNKTKRYGVNLAITLNESAEEPWYLATNLRRASSAVCWYERRFRCEEIFRDLKDQLNLERVWIQDTRRMEQLVFGLVTLYYAITLIGVIVQQRGLRKRSARTASVWFGSLCVLST